MEIVITLEHIAWAFGGFVGVVGFVAWLAIWYANVNNDRKRQRADTEKLQASTEKLEVSTEGLRKTAAEQRADTEKLQASTEKLEVSTEGLKKTAAKLKADNRHFKVFMKRVESKLDNLSTMFHQMVGVQRKNVASDPSVAEGKSPIKLNETGRAVSEEIGSKEWANAHAETVREQVAGMNPYDIQSFCVDHVTEDILSEVELEKAKAAAFKNGIDLSSVLLVMALDLRNHLLTPEELGVSSNKRI